MVDWALTFARDLGLAVWLGGLIAIDFVETPARFRVPALNRNQVVAVGREVFMSRELATASASADAVSRTLPANADDSAPGISGDSCLKAEKPQRWCGSLRQTGTVIAPAAADFLIVLCLLI